jgi:hypothetical protein
MRLGPYILSQVDVAPEELIYGAQNAARVEDVEAIYDAYLRILEKGMGR